MIDETRNRLLVTMAKAIAVMKGRVLKVYDEPEGGWKDGDIVAELDGMPIVQRDRRG